MKLVVPPEAAGARLDRFLATCEPVGSRADAERLLADGAGPGVGARRGKSPRPGRMDVQPKSAIADPRPTIAMLPLS